MSEKTDVLVGISPIKIKTLDDINYKDMLEDYEYHFCQNIATVETNYKKLEYFDVFFEPKQLPHLMGWDKILSSRMQAQRINSLIKKEEITLESTRKHKDFNDVRRRMESYNFFHDIFTHQNEKICVMTSDMKPNSMRVDIVFYKEHQRDATILGLRKSKGMGYFVPTTIHNRSLNNQFSKRRRTLVKKIVWS